MDQCPILPQKNAVLNNRFKRKQASELFRRPESFPAAVMVIPIPSPSIPERQFFMIRL
jgi:hypothetical protein